MNTRKIIYLFIGAMFLVLTGFLIQGPTQANAAHEVQVEVVTPPVVEIPDNPEMVMVPKTKVYYIKKEPHIVYYSGKWYRQYETRWYTSTTYSGPWVTVKTTPKVIMTVPETVPEGTIIRYKEIR